MPKHVLDVKTTTILDDFGKFFREFPDVPTIEEEPFWLWFRSFAHPKLTPEQYSIYQSLLSQVQEPVPPALETGLMARLVAADTASQLVTMLERYNDGEEINLGAALRATIDRFEADTNRKVKTPWVQDDIGDLLQAEEHNLGFHWRLTELGLSIRALRSGDFLLIAARPDVGKTSFLSDTLTHFAPQVDIVFPEQERVILWLNNEGPGRRIIPRLYQAALNIGMTEMVARNNAGTLKDEYIAATGRKDIIRVMDVHDFWHHEIEDIIREVNPAIIVWDMVDNIKFGGDTNNNGQRTDQLLEAMYQWVRVIGVKHDCVNIATSQISADGENMRYPLMSMLKDSKTGKQGAADAILTIGFQVDFPSERYLGLPKNKLALEGGPKQPSITVTFDGARSRFREPRELAE